MCAKIFCKIHTQRRTKNTQRKKHRDTHQEKPHLLICGNKLTSALVNRGQADFDWPTVISSSQWYISSQSATWSLIEYLFLFIIHWCLAYSTTHGDMWELLQKDYLRDIRVRESIREWAYIKRCSLFEDIARRPWDRCLWTKFWIEMDAWENERNRNDAHTPLSPGHQARNLE